MQVLDELAGGETAEIKVFIEWPAEEYILSDGHVLHPMVLADVSEASANDNFMVGGFAFDE